MFENSIFKIEFSILLGLFPHHNLYRLTFQSFVLREYKCHSEKKVGHWVIWLWKKKGGGGNWVKGNDKKGGHSGLEKSKKGGHWV